MVKPLQSVLHKTITTKVLLVHMPMQETINLANKITTYKEVMTTVTKMTMAVSKLNRIEIS